MTRAVPVQLYKAACKLTNLKSIIRLTRSNLTKCTKILPYIINKKGTTGANNKHNRDDAQN